MKNQVIFSSSLAQHHYHHIEKDCSRHPMCHTVIYTPCVSSEKDNRWLLYQNKKGPVHWFLFWRERETSDTNTVRLRGKVIDHNEVWGRLELHAECMTELEIYN